jgi:type IV pilus assembly protein PilM
MALFNSVRYNYGDLEGCTVIVDIGARTTNLLFIEQNRVFSRSIPIAGNAITQNIASEFSVPFLEAEQLKKTYGFVALGGAYEEPENQTQARVSKIIRNVMTRLHAEVARSINFYRSQQAGGAPSRLLLSGGSSIIPYTDRFFKEKVQIPIEYFNPFRNVEIDPQISREDLARCAHFFGEVVGLGLRKYSECPIEVNLVPKSLRTREQMEQKRPYFAGAAVCILVIPLCWLAYTKKTSALKEQQLQKVSEEVNRLDNLSKMLTKEQQQLTEVQGKADQIVSLVQQRSLWPEILQDINTRIGSNLWVVSLLPEGETASETEHARPAAPIGRGRGRAVEDEHEEAAPAARGSAPTPSATAGPKSIAEVRIEGAGTHLPQNPERDFELVDGFVRSLRESPYFDKSGVVIDVPPNPTMRGSTFTFTMRAKFAKPITL